MSSRCLAPVRNPCKAHCPRDVPSDFNKELQVAPPEALPVTQVAMICTLVEATPCVVEVMPPPSAALRNDAMAAAGISMGAFLIAQEHTLSGWP